MKKKVISGLGNTTEIASSAALPYSSFCTMVVVTNNCISENQEAPSSIFHQKNVESYWLQLLAHPAHTRCCARLGLLQTPAKWAHRLASSCQSHTSLGSFGVLFPWEWRGCSSLSLETPRTSHDRFLREPWSWCPPMGQGTVVPPVMLGADMLQGRTGSGRRRLAKMLLKLYHRWR